MTNTISATSSSSRKYDGEGTSISVSSYYIVSAESAASRASPSRRLQPQKERGESVGGVESLTISAASSFRLLCIAKPHHLGAVFLQNGRRGHCAKSPTISAMYCHRAA